MWLRAFQFDTSTIKSINEARTELRRALAGRHVLFIIDDVFDAQQALHFMTGDQASAVLLTTRRPDVAVALASIASNVYTLKVLAYHDGIELFQALAPDIMKLFPGECKQLVKSLDGLPLALQVAGRLLLATQHRNFGVEDLLAALPSTTPILGETLPFDTPELTDALDLTPTISALLRKSTDLLGPTFRDYYAVLGELAPKPAVFGLPLLRDLWEVDDPRSIAGTLLDWGLLEAAGIGKGTYWMHGLLVAHAHTLLAERQN